MRPRSSAGHKPIQLDYSVEKQNDGWKVFDVVVAGVSLVTNYRDTFNQEVPASGVDGLIQMLVEQEQAERSRQEMIEKNGNGLQVSGTDAESPMRPPLLREVLWAAAGVRQTWRMLVDLAAVEDTDSALAVWSSPGCARRRRSRRCALPILRPA